MARLLHYTNKEFDLEHRNYCQGDRYWTNKPTGLWFSVEGDNDWEKWCREQEYCLENLEVLYEVTLHEGSRILYLKTRDEMVDFCGDQVDWDGVKEGYQGIIIAPYHKYSSVGDDCPWYIGWDCASGCLWDLKCIKEFKKAILPPDAHLED